MNHMTPPKTSKLLSLGLSPSHTFPHTFPYTSPTFPAFPDLPKIPMPKGTSARNSIVHSEIVCQHVSIRHL